jgi:YjbR
VLEARHFRRIALGMTGAVEGAHMGHPDFRVNNRIFATLNADETLGTVMLTPAQQQEVLARAPAAFVPASGAWGRGGSTTVRLASADNDLLGEAMTLAWQNAVEKGATRPRKRRLRR